MARLEQGLAAAIACGQLPANLDAQRTAVGLHALVNGLISKWVMDPDAMPVKNDAGDVIDVFLEGIQRAPSRIPAKRAAHVRKAPRGKAAKPASRRRSVNT